MDAVCECSLVLMAIAFGVFDCTAIAIREGWSLRAMYVSAFSCRFAPVLHMLQLGSVWFVACGLSKGLSQDGYGSRKIEVGPELDGAHPPTMSGM